MSLAPGVIEHCPASPVPEVQSIAILDFPLCCPVREEYNPAPMSPLTQKVTLTDVRTARADGRKVPMLTCYDYTSARLMQQAGVPALLVGDSAANVILGHPTTIAVPLDFLIQITAAVRRGAPNCFIVGDMPFGSYQASTAQGVKNV